MKVGKEVMTMRECVSHFMRVATNVGHLTIVVVISSVQAAKSAEVCSGLVVRGDGAFLVLRDCSNVIIEGG